MSVRSLLTTLQLQHKELDMGEKSGEPEHAKPHAKPTRKRSVFSSMSSDAPALEEPGNETKSDFVSSAHSQGSWGRTMFAHGP